MSINKSLSIISFFMLLSVIACKEKPNTAEADTTNTSSEPAPFFKISLAQWSLNKAIRNGGMDPYDFAQKSKEMGFEGIEYVSQLYRKQVEENGIEAVQKILKEKSEKFGVENVLIMIDGEGNLATSDEKERNQAIENHKKWVDAAAYLGCHAIRVNLSGDKDKDSWTASSVKGLGELAKYGATKNIKVIVENHGGLSSNAEFLSAVMDQINLPNCGTLPDFGNFCIERKDGKCIELYDYYKGTEILMKHAKAVSAKSYDFDEAGNETTLDYPRLLSIVKDAGYTGYIGIEYEGSRLGEEEGIIATRDLLLNAAKTLK